MVGNMDLYLTIHRVTLSVVTGGLGRVCIGYSQDRRLCSTMLKHLARLNYFYSFIVRDN